MQADLKDKHKNILLSLFPPGIIWEQLKRTKSILGIMKVIASECGKIEEVAFAVLDEFDPRHSIYHLIGDWTRIMKIDQNIDIFDQHDAILKKLNWRSGQLHQDYFDAATICGLQLEAIDTCPPFIVEDSTCEDLIYSDAWRCHLFFYVGNISYFYANCECDCEAIVESAEDLPHLIKDILRKVPVFVKIHFVYRQLLFA